MLMVIIVRMMMKGRCSWPKYKCLMSPNHSLFAWSNSQYLEAMQKVRLEYEAQYRQKQENLIKALSDESSLWITEENIDQVRAFESLCFIYAIPKLIRFFLHIPFIKKQRQKITDDLFDVAGNSTFMPTRRSRDWHYMALPKVPDFSAYSEEDLFDENEDLHFLTENSPFHGKEKSIEIPEGHEVRERKREMIATELDLEHRIHLRVYRCVLVNDIIFYIRA